jgi:hypothetical protein
MYIVCVCFFLIRTKECFKFFVFFSFFFLLLTKDLEFRFKKKEVKKLYEGVSTKLETKQGRQTTTHTKVNHLTFKKLNYFS